MLADVASSGVRRRRALTHAARGCSTHTDPIGRISLLAKAGTQLQIAGIVEVEIVDVAIAPCLQDVGLLEHLATQR